ARRVLLSGQLLSAWDLLLGGADRRNSARAAGCERAGGERDGGTSRRGRWHSRGDPDRANVGGFGRFRAERAADDAGAAADPNDGAGGKDVARSSPFSPGRGIPHSQLSLAGGRQAGGENRLVFGCEDHGADGWAVAPQRQHFQPGRQVPELDRTIADSAGGGETSSVVRERHGKDGAAVSFELEDAL